MRSLVGARTIAGTTRRLKAYGASLKMARLHGVRLASCRAAMDDAADRGERWLADQLTRAA